MELPVFARSATKEAMKSEGVAPFKIFSGNPERGRISFVPIISIISEIKSISRVFWSFITRKNEYFL